MEKWNCGISCGYGMVYQDLYSARLVSLSPFKVERVRNMGYEFLRFCFVWKQVLVSGDGKASGQVSGLDWLCDAHEDDLDGM